MEKFGIQLSSGNAEILDLENAILQIESHSGNVICGNLDKVNIQTTSGNIKVGNANIANLKAHSRKYKSK